MGKTGVRGPGSYGHTDIPVVRLPGAGTPNGVFSGPTRRGREAVWITSTVFVWTAKWCWGDSHMKPAFRSNVHNCLCAAHTSCPVGAYKSYKSLQNF